MAETRALSRRFGGALPFVLLLCLVAGALFAWSRWNIAPGEFDELGSKHEYSILQAFEYNYRKLPNDAPIRFRRNAASSSSDLIGFPIAGRPTGYVWYIANPEVIPKISPMPADVEPVVPQDAVEYLRARVRLDPVLSAELRRRERASTTK